MSYYGNRVTQSGATAIFVRTAAFGRRRKILAFASTGSPASKANYTRRIQQSNWQSSQKGNYETGNFDVLSDDRMDCTGNRERAE
jgi:hypothetical protein